jgi:hypothetical protein
MRTLCQSIKMNIVKLSLNQFSSNALEKCLDLISDMDRYNLMKELLVNPKSHILNKNKYGQIMIKLVISKYLSFFQKVEIKNILMLKILSQTFNETQILGFNSIVELL